MLGLQSSNPDYPQAFVDQKEGLPSLVTAGEDKEFWQLISDMFFAFHSNVSIFAEGDTLSVRYEKHLQELIGLKGQVQQRMNNAGNHDPSKEWSLLSLTAQQNEAGDESQTAASSVLNLSPEVNGTFGLNDNGPADDNEDNTGASDTLPVKQRKMADDFEIWSLVRLCSMIERGGRRNDKIWPALLQCGFEELYDEIGNGFLRKDFNEKEKLDRGVSQINAIFVLLALY